MTDTTTDLATLEALFERVKQATGPDWRLDSDLDKALNKKWKPWNYIPRYTGCLSAATELADEMLPGCDYGVSRYEGQYSAFIGVVDKDNPRHCLSASSPLGKAPTAPLAILTVLLKAQIAIVSGVTEEPRT